MKQRKQEGFTIIEVLIVLAIAGLIMVIVFLAVPNLQRSARNNAVNSAATSTLSTVAEYVSNNNGTLPAEVAISGNEVTVGASGTNQAKVTVGEGTITGISRQSGTSPVITNSAAIGTAQLVVGTTAKCNPTASGLQGTASARAYVLLYVTEGSGSINALKCVAS